MLWAGHRLELLADWVVWRTAVDVAVRDLRPGDVVRFRVGGPAMTVASVRPAQAGDTRMLVRFQNWGAVVLCDATTPVRVRVTL